MKKLLLAIVITFVPLIIPAQASDLTGEALALACQGNVPNLKRHKDTEKYTQFCNAYINGWDDARFAFLQGTTTYCPPKITVKQTSVVFFDYLATHKEARKLPAAEALMSAFKDKWPCPPQAAEKQDNAPEQACQAQALASIASKWKNVRRGQFEVIVKGNRCLVFLQAPAIFEGKRTAWLIEGTIGDLLAEFYAPITGAELWKDSDRGPCSFRGGKFPTGECTWSEYMDKADQM
jgi:Rap1a immunity proteins